MIGSRSETKCAVIKCIASGDMELAKGLDNIGLDKGNKNLRDQNIIIIINFQISFMFLDLGAWLTDFF